MYAKVRRSMFEGTLAGTGETWAVFVFLLAHSDPEGFVDIHPKAISGLTGFSEDGVRAALAKLESADPNSRRPDAEGARIVRVDEHRDWGWHITNYKYYRSSKDEQTVREQTAARVRKNRNKSAPVSQGNADVTHGNALKRHVEVDVEVEEERNESKDLATDVAETGGSLNGKADPEDLTWGEIFETWFWGRYPRKVGKPAAKKAWNGVRPQTQDTVEAMNEGLGLWEGFWAKKDKDFIPHPATWLNQRRWEDQP